MGSHGGPWEPERNSCIPGCEDLPARLHPGCPGSADLRSATAQKTSSRLLDQPRRLCRQVLGPCSAGAAWRRQADRRSALPGRYVVSTGLYSHGGCYGWTIALYGLAKLTEYFDRAIYAALPVASGHNLKHTLAAAVGAVRCGCRIGAGQRPVLRRRNTAAKRRTGFKIRWASSRYSFNRWSSDPCRPP